MAWGLLSQHQTLIKNVVLRPIMSSVLLNDPAQLVNNNAQMFQTLYNFNSDRTVKDSKNANAASIKRSNTAEGMYNPYQSRSSPRRTGNAQEASTSRHASKMKRRAIRKGY